MRIEWVLSSVCMSMDFNEQHHEKTASQGYCAKRVVVAHSKYRHVQTSGVEYNHWENNVIGIAIKATIGGQCIWTNIWH